MSAKPRQVERDERTQYVENASYRWGYMFLTFALLVLTAYRGLVLDQAGWDLLGLVIVSGAVVTGYQARERIVGRRSIMTGLLAAVVAAGIAVVLVLLR